MYHGEPQNVETGGNGRSLNSDVKLDCLVSFVVLLPPSFHTACVRFTIHVRNFFVVCSHPALEVAVCAHLPTHRIQIFSMDGRTLLDLDFVSVAMQIFVKMLTGTITFLEVKSSDKLVSLTNRFAGDSFHRSSSAPALYCQALIA